MMSCTISTASPTTPRSASLEDRSVPILVDGDDATSTLHTRDVLGRATDAHGDVQLRSHRLARLADLHAVGHPTRIDDWACRADGGVADQGGEVAQERKVDRIPQSSPARNHDLRLFELYAV